MEMNDEEQKYEPAGNNCEVGMLKFLISQETPVVEMLQAKSKTGIRHTVIPFSPERKIMTVAYQVNGEFSPVDVVIKGAPEEIVPLCTSMMDSSNNGQRFGGDGQEGANLLDAVINEIARKGEKPFVYAHKQMDINQFR
mmetsp:Transcript_29300/g.21213  ORF Transcript_29300/g.21213 Transcript_29300/m.21213 type:complete len:139 (+) Transcript_29300:1594-2010(+)